MVNAIVITGFGINCEGETGVALQRAGAKVVRVHVNDLIDAPDKLNDAQIFAVPGGFSFGDDVASGRILANRLRHRLAEPLHQFVDDGKLVIGICNGFQVLVKMGILPLFDGEFRQEVTLTHNDSDRFEDRWVHLGVEPNTRCVWLNGIDRFDVPVRHGEGKFLVPDDATLKRLESNGQIALRYLTDDGQPANGAYPANPNGSTGDIAGICDPSGRIFGLMPHPEAFLDATNHPCWTRLGLTGEGQGLQLFRNAVAFAEKELVAAA